MKKKRGLVSCIQEFKKGHDFDADLCHRRGGL